MEGQAEALAVGGSPCCPVLPGLLLQMCLVWVSFGSRPGGEGKDVDPWGAEVEGGKFLLLLSFLLGNQGCPESGCALECGFLKLGQAILPLPSSRDTCTNSTLQATHQPRRKARE